MPRAWKSSWGYDYAYAKRGKNRHHYVRVRTSEDGTLTPLSRTMCGAETGDPSPGPFLGRGECRVCYREVWGKG